MDSGCEELNRCFNQASYTFNLIDVDIKYWWL